MTVGELREELAKYPDATVVYAFDGYANNMEPVTGMLFDPAMFGVEGRLEFQTDEP